MENSMGNSVSRVAALPVDVTHGLLDLVHTGALPILEALFVLPGDLESSGGKDSWSQR